jgi:signal transduction histidine kinase
MCLEVIDILQSEMLTHDIICKFKVKQGYRALNVSWAELDPSRVQQVVSRILISVNPNSLALQLINLLVNAIKFTAAADQRIITLTLDATTARPCLPGESLEGSPNSFGRTALEKAGMVNLVFEVRDTGIGMTEAEIQRVFQRFVQGSNRTHLTYGGSGLGKLHAATHVTCSR